MRAAIAAASCADSSRIAVANSSARALVSASAVTRSCIRASRSSASLDICAILRLSLEQTYDSSIDAEAVDELDVQGILAFEKRVLPRASDLWVQASLDQKQRLQQLFFPEGVAFDGNRLNRTATTASLFKYLAPGENAEERVVGLTFASWNQIALLLLELDSNIAEAHRSLAHVLTIYDFDWAVASHAAGGEATGFMSGSRIGMLLLKLSLRRSVRESCAMLTGPSSRAGIALGSSHGQTSDGARHGARRGGTAAATQACAGASRRCARHACPSRPASVALTSRSAFPC